MTLSISRLLAFALRTSPPAPRVNYYDLPLDAPAAHAMRTGVRPPRYVVMHEVWRDVDHAPGVRTLGPVLLCVEAERAGRDGWHLLSIVYAETLVEVPRCCISPGERVDIERRLDLEERLAKDNEQREVRHAG